MNALDAVFLAIAARMFVSRDAPGWKGALAPLIGYGAAWAGLGRATQPVAALAVAALGGPDVAGSLLLASPSYPSLFHAVLATALWWWTSRIILSIEDQLELDSIAPVLRGAPLRLLLCAALYWTLWPLNFL